MAASDSTEAAKVLCQLRGYHGKPIQHHQFFRCPLCGAIAYFTIGNKIIWRL